MGDRLKYHLKKAELYGLLMKKYKYENPALHDYFYRKHYYHAQCVDRLYMQSKHGGAGMDPAWESSGSGSAWPGGGWPGMSGSSGGWPGMGSPGVGFPGMGTPGGGWPGMSGSSGGWPGMGSPGMGSSGAGREESEQ